MWYWPRVLGGEQIEVRLKRQVEARLSKVQGKNSSAKISYPEFKSHLYYPSCVTLNKLIGLSGRQFLHLK